jgi:hypothetical protein
MTDDKDYTVASVQPNGRGAVADIEGTCQNPGQVAFVATLRQVSDPDSPLGLPDFGDSYIAGTKRINDEPAFPTHFEMEKFRNRILISKLTSLDPTESLEATWRVLAQIETAHGQIVMQIPMFNPNVQKLIVACGKQYENAKKRGRLADAPRALQ